MSTSFAAAFALAKGKPATKREKREKKNFQARAPKINLPDLPNFQAQLLQRAQDRDQAIAQKRVDAAASKEMALLPRDPKLGFRMTPIMSRSRLTLPSYPRHTTQAFAMTDQCDPVKVAKLKPEPISARYSPDPQPPRPETPSTNKQMLEFLRGQEGLVAEADAARNAKLQADASRGLVNYFVRIMT